MMDTEPDLTARLAARLRGLRSERGLTLERLAERAGVSRSMISLVERGESSPTAAVLDRIAAGLGVTLASLFAAEPRADAAPLLRRADQVDWRDPETGYVRRNLSPPGYPSPIELVEVVLPARTRVAYDTVATRAAGVSQQVWVLDGHVDLTLGTATHHLAPGDCLAMRLDRPVAFRNAADAPARYLVALAVDTSPDAGAAHPNGGPR
jgi:transcriptional regulator with XRE-family HTH domain